MRLALLLLGLFYFLGSGVALGAVKDCSTYSVRCSYNEAEAYCEAHKGADMYCRHFPDGLGRGYFSPYKGDRNFGVIYPVGHYNVNCPNGSPWNPSTNQCTTDCPAGEWPDPSNPGQCLSPDICRGRQGDAATFGDKQGTSKSWCIAGCTVEFKYGASHGTCVSGMGRPKECWFTGEVEYTGGQCSFGNNNSPPPPEAPPPEAPQPKPVEQPNECTNVPGQTLCVKPDGSHCAAVGNNRQICWKPHETGQKTDKDWLQKKRPGSTPGESTIGLSNGDTANKKGGDIVVNQTTKDGRTSTTTITNYQSSSGANAGNPSNDAGQSPGSGDGDDDGSTAGGGGDCDTPPVMTGDAVSMMIARQAWETRCAVERLNDIQVTGDVENCNSPFSVTGTNAQVHNLRALREKICGEPSWAKGDKPNSGDANNGDGDEGGVKRFGLGFSPSMLDKENIFGGGSCPTFTVTIMRATFSTSDLPAWCRIVVVMRAVVLIMGAYTALMILYGRN